MTARGPRDAGAVTAELALGLVAVVLVLAALLVTVSAASARVVALDAARAAARVAALGEPDDVVADVAARVAPGAQVAVRREPPWVEVVVRRPLGGAWFTGGGLVAQGSAVAWVEP